MIVHRGTGDRSDLTREAKDREKIATVRLHINVNDVFTEILAERRAERRLRVKDQNAVTVIRGIELRARAEHPL